MKSAIRYYTRSGNTKKLAEAAAKVLGVEALDIGVALEEKVDTLFLGCSYYAFDIDNAVKEFIIANRDKIGKIVCFGTSAMMKSMKKPVRKVTEPLGLKLAEDEFHCRGQFAKVHKGRPDENDINAFAAFVRKISE